MKVNVVVYSVVSNLRRSYHKKCIYDSCKSQAAQQKTVLYVC